MRERHRRQPRTTITLDLRSDVLSYFSDSCGSTLQTSRPTHVDVDRCLDSIGRIRPKFDRFRPILAEGGPTLAEVGADLAPKWPMTLALSSFWGWILCCACSSLWLAPGALAGSALRWTAAAALGGGAWLRELQRASQRAPKTNQAESGA